MRLRLSYDRSAFAVRWLAIVAIAASVAVLAYVMLGTVASRWVEGIADMPAKPTDVVR